MTSPMYTHALPDLKQMLTALKAILAQACSHTAAKSKSQTPCLVAGAPLSGHVSADQAGADCCRLCARSIGTPSAPDRCRTVEESAVQAVANCLLITPPRTIAGTSDQTHFGPLLACCRV